MLPEEGPRCVSAATHEGGAIACVALWRWGGAFMQGFGSTCTLQSHAACARYALSSTPGCTFCTDPEARRWLRRRCAATRGSWCGKYERQAGAPLRPPPRGNLTCPNNCNGVGNCNYDIGRCDCPAGTRRCGRSGVLLNRGRHPLKSLGWQPTSAQLSMVAASYN